jgi:multidrug transporter EmrE-like cation transporter
VWTSIGAAGTVAVSILFFGELYNTVKLIAIITILAGVTLLKIS